MAKNDPPPIDPDEDDREDTVVEAPADIRQRFKEEPSSDEDGGVFSSSRSAEAHGRSAGQADDMVTGLTGVSDMPGLSDLQAFSDESEEEATAILPHPERAQSSMRIERPVVPLEASTRRLALDADEDDATQHMPGPRALSDLAPLDGKDAETREHTMSNPILFRQTVQPSGEGTPGRLLEKAVRRTVAEAQSKLIVVADAAGAPAREPATPAATEPEAPPPPTGPIRPLPESLGAEPPTTPAVAEEKEASSDWDDDDDLFADDALDAARVLVVRSESQEQPGFAQRPVTTPGGASAGTDEQNSRMLSASGNARSFDGSRDSAAEAAGDAATLPADATPAGIWASDDDTPSPAAPTLPPEAMPAADDLPAEFDQHEADTDAADGPAEPPHWADASLDDDELDDDDDSQTTGIHHGATRPLSELQEAGLGLLIVDAPPHAAVFLDGNDIGRGRVEVDGLNRYQSYAVRVHHRGHRPWSGSVSLEGHAEAVVRPELEPR